MSECYHFDTVEWREIVNTDTGADCVRGYCGSCESAVIGFLSPVYRVESQNRDDHTGNGEVIR